MKKMFALAVTLYVSGLFALFTSVNGRIVIRRRSLYDRSNQGKVLFKMKF